LTQCVNCNAREACVKGCYHCNWLKNHDLFKPTEVNCTVNREVVRLTLWIDRELRGTDPSWWKRKLSTTGNGAQKHKPKQPPTSQAAPGQAGTASRPSSANQTPPLTAGAT